MFGYYASFSAKKQRNLGLRQPNRFILQPHAQINLVFRGLINNYFILPNFSFIFLAPHLILIISIAAASYSSKYQKFLLKQDCDGYS
jgi:hypothetical protein